MPHRFFMLTLLSAVVAFVPARAAEPDISVIDRLVGDAVKAFDVPGAAVVIVHNDKVIYLKGHGVREKGKSEAVTPDTVFAIASCSKAFTATGAALLVADGKMSWDDPVRKHVDWFRLADPAADREVTIRDLLCHRTGMPRHDMLWAGTGLTSEEYARAYGRAKPSTSFRSKWEYANVTFTTAGLASGSAAGSDWPTLIRTRLFEPLGMKTAYCSAAEALKNPDHAIPHNRHPDGRITPVARADVDSVRAAGSINASVRDLGQWLRFQLADGKIGDKRLIPSSALRETRTAQMIVRQEGRWLTFFPEKATQHLAYGLGWFVHDYRGQLAVSHGGTLDGFRAQTMLIPDKKLGVVVLGNLTPSTFPEALGKTLVDHMLGLPNEDWNKFYTANDKATEAAAQTAAKARAAARKPNSRPSRDLADYVGVYAEPAYGKLEVLPVGNQLLLKWGKIEVLLEHYHFDSFTGKVSGPTTDDVVRYQRQTFEPQFQLNGKGDITSVKFLDQEFVRTNEHATFDVLIRGGTVYDGSGKQPRVTDIGLRGERIAAIGDLKDAKAKTVIEGKGLAIAPGFINMLSWSTESLLADGLSQSELRQGVTTQIMGESESMGPVNEAIRKRMLTEQTDIKFNIEWQSLSEYLYFLERKGVAQNVASFIGASTIREYVLGRDNKKASAEELDRMRKLVEIEMRAGALGIGSALEYAPAYYADTNELIELCKVAARYQGKYITHMRSEGRQMHEAIDEVIRISREAKIPAEIYHFKAAGKDNWGKLDDAIAKIEAARKEGLKITADMYCYTAGCTGLDACIPPWAQDGGLQAMRRRLREPEARQRIKSDMAKNDWPNFYINAGGPKNILLVGFKKEALKPLQGKTLEDVAAQRRCDPVDCLMDLLAEDESRITTVYFMMNEDNVKKIMKLPWVSFGSDEASQAPEGVFLKAMPHPRAYGNFARLLGKYVRDEKLIPMEEAIRKLTHLPATNLGLERRGQLREGYFADVVIFEPNAVADKATYDKPHQYSVGVQHVFVNGVHALKNGEPTGAKPGKALWGPGRIDGPEKSGR